MTCHICSLEVEVVRSVLIRPWLPEWDEWGTSIDPPKWDTPAYESYKKNVTFRRSFICEHCYQIINADPTALAEIPGFGQWNLSDRSRYGKAPIYDHKKWLRYQRSKASQMGIEL